MCGTRLGISPIGTRWVGPKRNLLAPSSYCRGRWRNSEPTCHLRGSCSRIAVDTIFSFFCHWPAYENLSWLGRPVLCVSMLWAPKKGQVPTQWPWPARKASFLWLFWGRLWAAHSFSGNVGTSWSVASTWHLSWISVVKQATYYRVWVRFRGTMTAATLLVLTGYRLVWISFRRLRPYPAMFYRSAGKSWALVNNA